MFASLKLPMEEEMSRYLLLNCLDVPPTRDSFHPLPMTTRPGFRSEIFRVAEHHPEILQELAA